MESERAKNLVDLYINTATFEVVSQVKIIEADVSRCINTHSDDSTPFYRRSSCPPPEPRLSSRLWRYLHRYPARFPLIQFSQASQYLDAAAPKHVELPEDILAETRRRLESAEHPERIYIQSQRYVCRELCSVSALMCACSSTDSLRATSFPSSRRRPVTCDASIRWTRRALLPPFRRPSRARCP